MRYDIFFVLYMNIIVYDFQLQPFPSVKNSQNEEI